MSIYIPKKVNERIINASKKYKRILDKAVKADINESDTVMVVRDMLEEIFGYDRFGEITTEYAIRNIYCDVAIKLQDKLLYLIEAKAIGTDLKENHLRQAQEYSSTSGLDWVILTNGRVWKIFRMVYKKPIRVEKVFEIDWLSENIKDEGFIERVFCLCKEGISKTALTQYEEEKQATNRHILGAIILGESILKNIKREVKKVSSINVSIDDLHTAIKEEVIKREVVEGDEAIAALKKYKSMLLKEAKKKKSQSIEEQI